MACQSQSLTGKPLLQIVLACLPAFWQHDKGVLLRSVEKGRATRLILTPLTYTESLAYIRHRLLQVCAGADTVFNAEAMGKIRDMRAQPRIMN